MRNRILIGSLALTLALGIAGCGRSGPAYGDIPSKIKVTVDGNMYVRSAPDSESPVVGTAPVGTVLRVIDALPVYYKITLPDGVSGWISANPRENWTVRVDENLVKVMHEGGLAVRKEAYKKDSPQVGVAAKAYTFDIQTVEYSHYRVVLENGKKGWIYAGRPVQMLVEKVFLP
jgi:uncharacterized protein YgiM (DUF1202 family)